MYLAIRLCIVAVVAAGLVGGVEAAATETAATEAAPTEVLAMADELPPGTRGFASTADSAWAVRADGEIFGIEIGSLPFENVANVVGDLGEFGLVFPIVDATDSHGGLLALSSDGGVFALFGAPFSGSIPELGVKLVSPITGFSVTRGVGGYWIVGEDGGVFAFGEAKYHGSLPGLGLVPSSAIVDIVSTPTGDGYWLIGSDGGVFAFGDALYLGGLPSRGIPDGEVVGMATHPNGYWLIERLGRTTAFGAVPNFGSYEPPSHSQIGIADVDTNPFGGYTIGLGNTRLISYGPQQ